MECNKISIRNFRNIESAEIEFDKGVNILCGSGGMQKRAGLARAIVRDAEIVLYDEPTSGLDPVTSAVIERLIVDLNRSRGVTSVVVTHDLAMAARTSSRIMLIKDGKSVACLPPDEFMRCGKREVAEFVGAAKGDRK